ncbi:MAG: tyrosine-protein phosphatase [SAR202 cluster bacterium]|jgi:protein-tyrosine phosphatase|nr:tyrosine-protein phosphatase [SAR202 cluster bacterium]MDP7104970.1 tyrosine-protein phosphatase [SAR202 cluster bacterium]MDP7226558.1 tyrosine-protein phosphatase [SAR202 cluster bacterium]MDP7414776.1 tyrosine-protein phosphatase [SAR202 cluster bacterium]MDP7534631.1 tyrosine-protein phosphatase [SAR202 cluster bacterium]|tara:strand:+ start:1977 stop:2417 length:441 start_codon:yes stop_codon:yes gene_type:complete
MESYPFSEETYEAEWVIEGILARAQRPGYPVDRPPAETVHRWVDAALELGVRSVICILDHDQLSHYDHVGLAENGLLDHYFARGFEVAHVPADDYKTPPLTNPELDEVWIAFEHLEKPVLVHCSAGRDRSGAAIEHIRARLSEVAD